MFKYYKKTGSINVFKHHHGVASLNGSDTSEYINEFDIFSKGNAQESELDSSSKCPYECRCPVPSWVTGERCAAPIRRGRCEFRVEHRFRWQLDFPRYD